MAARTSKVWAPVWTVTHREGYVSFANSCTDKQYFQYSHQKTRGLFAGQLVRAGLAPRAAALPDSFITWPDHSRPGAEEPMLGGWSSHVTLHRHASASSGELQCNRHRGGPSRPGCFLCRGTQAQRPGVAQGAMTCCTNLHFTVISYC